MAPDDIFQAGALLAVLESKGLHHNVDFRFGHVAELFGEGGQQEPGEKAIPDEEAQLVERWRPGSRESLQTGLNEY